MLRSMDLNQISKIIDVDYIGDNHIINGLNLCNKKSEFNKILVYINRDGYLNEVLSNSSIRAIILTKELYNIYANKIGKKISFFIVEDPETYFYRLHHYLCLNTDFYEKFNFKSKVGNNCNIHDTSYISDGVIIGDNVTIGANSVVCKGSIIEDNVTIGNCSAIGCEGFQIVSIEGRKIPIMHVGKTKICNNVFIGNNTCIANSLFEGETKICKYSCIDNLVHVAHNCFIGENVVVTAGTILCGSSKLLDESWIGVNSSILNKVSIGSRAVIGIGSVVTRNISNMALAYGVPAKEKK